jgi:hypothetical protein
MKKTTIKTLHNGKQRFQLSANQVITIKDRRIRIDCLQGKIWVTWPNGNDRVLLYGQSMTVASKGVICVQTFSKSTVAAEKIKRWKQFHCHHFHLALSRIRDNSVKVAGKK